MESVPVASKSEELNLWRIFNQDIMSTSLKKWMLNFAETFQIRIISNLGIIFPELSRRYRIAE